MEKRILIIRIDKEIKEKLEKLNPKIGNISFYIKDYPKENIIGIAFYTYTDVCLYEPLEVFIDLKSNLNKEGVKNNVLEANQNKNKSS